MSESRGKNAQDESLRDDLEIDARCTAFEAAWRAGQVLRIEDMVAEAPARLRAELHVELVKLQGTLYEAKDSGAGKVDGREAETLPFANSARASSGDAATASRSPRAFTEDTEAPNIPGYAIERVLGRGGMGVVFAAEHLALKRLVALKIVRAGVHADDETIRRFRTEAEAIARLQHPNIIQIYEIGECNDLPYFSLEYCAGGSLDAKIKDAPMPAPEAARLVELIAIGVGAAHQRGVIHRDLKPANVLLLEDGTPKITDFGLAKKVSDAGQTQTGSVMGTPSYMAPEQAEGKGVGPAADIYALGAILYKLLTGRPPFRAATTLDTLFQVVNDEAAPPRQLQSSTPRDLETICMKCLQKVPAKRYASAEELAADVRRYLDGKPIKARPVGWSERAGKWVRRNPIVALLLGAVAMSVLLGSATATVLAIVAWNHAEESDRYAAIAATRADDALRAQSKAVLLANDLKVTLKKEQDERSKSDFLVYSLRLREAYAEIRRGRKDLALEVLGLCDRNSQPWEYQFLKRQTQPRLESAGHIGDVNSVAFSLDGRWIASGSADGTVRLLSAATGRALHTFNAHTGWVNSLAISDDCTRLVSGGNDKTVKVWDLTTKRETFCFTKHTAEVTALAISADGRYVVSASAKSGGIFVAQGEVHLWDLATGMDLATLKERKVRSVAINADGTRIVTGDKQGDVKVWDGAGKLIRSLLGHGLPVQSVAVNADGTRVFSGGVDRTIRSWNAESGEKIFVLDGLKSQILCVALSRDERRLVSGSDSGLIQTWDIATGRLRTTIKGDDVSISSVAFNAKGNQVVSGGFSGLVRVWDLQEFAGLAEKAPFRSCALSADGRKVAWTSDFETKVWECDTASLPVSFQPGIASNCVALSPNGTRLAIAAAKSVKVVNTANSEVELKLEGHTRDVLHIAFSADGTRIATGSGDSTAKIWDATTGKVLLELRGHSNGVTSVAFANKGDRVVTGSYDKAIKVWNAATGEILQDLRGHNGVVNAVSFSREGNLLVSGGVGNGKQPMPGELILWNLAKGEKVHGLKGHTAAVTGVAFHPDGTRFFSGSRDHSVRVWDVATGQESLKLEGHTTGVFSLALSTDGTRLVSVGGELLSDARKGELIIWDSAVRTRDDTSPASGDNVIFTRADFLKRSDPPDRIRKTSYHRAYEVELEKNVSYRIELIGTFDTFLRLEKQTGETVAENDDAYPGTLNSQITFRPTQSARYRCVVTSFEPGLTGRYIVSVKRLDAGK